MLDTLLFNVHKYISNWGSVTLATLINNPVQYFHIITVKSLCLCNYLCLFNNEIYHVIYCLKESRASRKIGVYDKSNESCGSGRDMLGY